MTQNTKGNKSRIILNKWNLAETGHWWTVKWRMPFWQVQNESGTQRRRAGEEHTLAGLSPRIPVASPLSTSNPAALISYNCYAFPTIRFNLSTPQKDPPPLSYHSNVTATALWIQILHLRDRRSLPRANSFHTEQHRKPPERTAFYS